jgi:hypothetical protein
MKTSSHGADTDATNTVAQVTARYVEQEEMMSHPEGGRGNCFTTKHTFQKAYEYVGAGGASFKSSTDECIHAKRGNSTMLGISQ